MLSNSTPLIPQTQKRLLVGEINGLFGIKGWVKIRSHTQPRKNILKYQPWYVQINAQWQTLAVVKGHAQGKTFVAQIKDIDNPEQAKDLIGLDVYIEKSQLPQLPKGEYYWADLIGLEVINQQQIVLGQVSNLVETGANTVLVVNGKKEHLLPYIEPFLIKIDIQKKQILVDWDADF